MSQRTQPDEGYDGPAELRTPEGSVLDVDVTVRGMFQPIDGRYHWYGRIVADEELDAQVDSGASVVLRTPHGEAAGRLSDRDPWGRHRITGTGVPPFEHES
jgi:hypothetical protein